MIIRLAWMLLAVLWSCGMAPMVAAEEWPIDDANPSASIPSAEERRKAPLELGRWLFEVTDRAEKALSSGDYARAARYFEAVVRLLPEQSIGHAKLCEARAHAGAIEEALSACREALERPGVRVQDYVRFLAVTLVRPGTVPAEAVQRFDEVLEHVEKEGVQSAEAQQLNCQLALRQNDDSRLTTCVGKLERWAPSDPATAAYTWARAMRLHDEKGARAAFERARELHHDPQKLEAMQAAMTTEFPSRDVWYWAAAGLFTLAGLGLLLALRFRTTPQRPTSPTLA